MGPLYNKRWRSYLAWRQTAAFVRAPTRDADLTHRHPDSANVPRHARRTRLISVRERRLSERKSLISAVPAAISRAHATNIAAPVVISNSYAGDIRAQVTVISAHGVISRMSGVISRVSGVISRVSGVISVVFGVFSCVSGVISRVLDVIFGDEDHHRPSGRGYQTLARRSADSRDDRL
jgi:hypothetical protein